MPLTYETLHLMKDWTPMRRIGSAEAAVEILAKDQSAIDKGDAQLFDTMSGWAEAWTPYERTTSPAEDYLGQLNARLNTEIYRLYGVPPQF